MLQLMLLLSGLLQVDAPHDSSRRGTFTALDQWTRIAPPAPGSAARARHETDPDHEWEVSLVGGELVVSAYTGENDWSRLPHFMAPPKGGPPLLSRLSAMHVADGYLIGSDSGEWGGWLSWSDPDGGRRYPILSGNVRGLARTGHSVVAVTGLAHMGSEEGAVYWLEAGRDGVWRPVHTVALGAAAFSFTLDPDGVVVVVTSKGLLRCSPVGPPHVLFSTDLSFLYPNSLVRSSRGYYIGARSVVVALEETEHGYVETWLTPPSPAKAPRGPAAGSSNPACSGLRFARR